MSSCTPFITRRSAIVTALAAAGGAASLPDAARAAEKSGLPGDAVDAAHARDWEWLVGRWNVRHRRLKERLAGSDEWVEFNGATAVWLSLGGLGTLDDNIINLPGGAYRAVGIRAFEPESRQWLAWWLDGRTPGEIGAPMRGGFKDGVGMFLGDYTIGGKPIKARYVWTQIDSPTPRWEQAFSADGGETWETNWIAHFARAS